MTERCAQEVPIPSSPLPQNPHADSIEPMSAPVSHSDTGSEKKFRKALQENRNL